MKCPYCKKQLEALKVVVPTFKIYDFVLAQTKEHGDYFAFTHPFKPIEKPAGNPTFNCSFCNNILAYDVNQAKEIMIQIHEDEKNIVRLSA